MGERIEVVYSSDLRYLRYAGASMLSVLSNTARAVRFHVQHAGIPEEAQEATRRLVAANGGECVFSQVDRGVFTELEKHISNANIRVESFFRLAVPSTLLDVDKAIYLDCDTLALSDIGEVFDHGLGGALLGAVEDGDIYQDRYDRAYGLDGHLYFCSGVMLMNLARLRMMDLVREACRVAGKLRTLAESTGLQFYEDQCVLNYLLKGRTTRLPRRFHVMLLSSYAKSPSRDGGEQTLEEYVDALCRPVVVHFTGLGLRMYEQGLIPEFPFVPLLDQYLAEVGQVLPSALVKDDGEKMGQYVQDWLGYFQDIASMSVFRRTDIEPCDGKLLALYGSSEYAFNCVAYLKMNGIDIEAVFDHEPEFERVFGMSVTEPKPGYHTLS
ncbi:MAG: glycosyltransferase family 8 protein, partial [Bifidobacteriaceae bacterium]|nr:glycosyltransferase family 8 protein [Bifidobacteriaceae bacterium]